MSRQYPFFQGRNAPNQLLDKPNINDVVAGRDDIRIGVGSPTVLNIFSRPSGIKVVIFLSFWRGLLVIIFNRE
jgi:hypothetical protein